MALPISRHRFDFQGGHCSNCTYLGNWALMALVIPFRFLLDFHPFLLKAIGGNILGPFFFLSTLEINVKVFSPWGCCMCPIF
jgi:hypothetical protein